MAGLATAEQTALSPEPDRAVPAHVHHADPLERRLHLLAASGGDERIWHHPDTGRTRYATTLTPAPDELWFSSSTASAISERGYRAALADLHALFGSGRRMPLPIDCDVSEIARIRMTPNSGQQMLGLDANADFHRCPSDEIHAALHDHELANTNRLAKINAIDGDGHAAHARVTNRGHRGRSVHHREDYSAKNVVQIVRVLRHHQLGGLVLRLPNCARPGSGH